jgi:hypothetical protein
VIRLNSKSIEDNEKVVVCGSKFEAILADFEVNTCQDVLAFIGSHGKQ